MYITTPRGRIPPLPPPPSHCVLFLPSATVHTGGNDATSYVKKEEKNWYYVRTRSFAEPLYCVKKNQSTPRPSEHPPVMGGKMSTRFLGGIKLLSTFAALLLSGAVCVLSSSVYDTVCL